MSAQNLSENLIQEVQTRYGVGRQYARAYLELFHQGRDHAYQHLDDILALPEPIPMWFEFALSTNWRGKTIVDLLQPYFPENASRYLDVGCGFGGFLVAFSQLGLQVCGIEIDQQRIDLAIANCQDNDLQDCVINASILEPDLVDRLGQFDLITCIDVIEHVPDVANTIVNMVALLKPGGILMLEIPNRDSLEFVAQDGHFSLFGITQLERQDAIRYHKAFFNFDYDVGDYFPLETYRAMLEAQDCQVSLIQSPYDSTSNHKRQHVRRFSRQYLRYRQQNKPRLPDNINRKIHKNVLRYLLDMNKNLLRHSLSVDGRDYLRRRYLQNFWKVLARKA